MIKIYNLAALKWSTLFLDNIRYEKPIFAY